MSETIVARDNRRKTRVGVVVSDKMDKTITVAVINRKSHPLYGKTVHNTVKFKAHDEKNECKVGDGVKIIETRPLSKDKRWLVLENLGKSSGSKKS